MQTQALETTNNESAVVPMDVSAAALQSALAGDLRRLTPDERLKFYGALCKFTGLNPLSKPFDWLELNGKLVLYANKGCAEQLRKIHKVSIDIIDRKVEFGCLVVRVKAGDGDGRHDESLAAVPFNERNPAEVANALMKVETKAKRRVTFSICGLSMFLDREQEDEPAKPAAVITDAETAQDRAARLNESLTAGEKQEAVDVPEVISPAPVVSPEPAATAPESAPPPAQAPSTSGTLSDEEVLNLEIVLSEKPDLQKAAVDYMVAIGGLEAGKGLEHLKRAWFEKIVKNPSALWRNVETFQKRRNAQAPH